MGTPLIGICLCVSPCIHSTPRVFSVHPGCVDES